MLGDNTTGNCVVRCPAGGYSDYILNLCVQNCNSSSFKQEITVSSNIIRACVTTCDSNGNQKYGNTQLGQCVSPNLCPLNTFGDNFTTFC